MPPPPPQNTGSGDHSLAPLWLTALIFVLCWLLWVFFHAQITAGVLYIRLWEARLIAFFTNQGLSLVNYVQVISPFPGQVRFDTLSDISAQIGMYLRYPIAVILLIFAGVVYFTHPLMRFRKRYDMKSLVQSERENWLQITPVVNLDLINVDIDSGPWAMALSPMQFAKKNHLLRKEKVLATTNKGIVTRHPIAVSLLRDRAYQIFAQQLGPLWESVDRLPIHRKALFAIFAARINLDRDGATKMLLQISASATPGARLNFSGVDALLQRHQNNRSVQYIMQHHAYVLTVLASLLVLARHDGVLACADFLWLKPTDRVLWFLLNSIGRQTAFTEVAGAFAHWLVERAIGRRLIVPMIDEAVNGLDLMIKDTLYIPEDDNDELS
jgi:intracellular multiplication protein IcmP